jgi:preprotein translocase subunit SecA
VLEVEADQVDREELTAQLQEEALALYERREQELGEELMRALERFLLLQIIDQRWREHLYDMDYLREGIHLRGFAQIEPLVAYKNEAFELFRDLMNSIWGDFARMIFHVEVTLEAADGEAAPPPVPQRTPNRRSSSATGGGRVSYSGGGMAQPSALAMAAASAGPAEGYAEEDAPLPGPVEQRRVDRSEQIGRNDPCWCGSGKKFKKCHGA